MEPPPEYQEEGSTECKRQDAKTRDRDHEHEITFGSFRNPQEREQLFDRKEIRKGREADKSKSAKAEELLKAVGAWFLFLPQYSPDLNPIEMAFAKLKTLIRKAAARTYDDLWRAVGDVCDLFTEQECQNFFRAAGYETS